MDFSGFNSLDIAIIVVSLLGAVHGLTNGLLKSLSGIGALIIGLFVASATYGFVTPFVSKLFHRTDWMEQVSFVVVLFIVVIIINIIEMLITPSVQKTSFIIVNKLGGIAVGVCKGLLICAIFLAIGQKVIPDTSLIHNSSLVPYLTPITNIIKNQLPTHFL